MSSMQKALKVLSIALIAAGIGLAIYTVASLFFTANPTALVLLVLLVLVTVFDFLLGGFGVQAANVPPRAPQLALVAIVGLLANAAATVTFLSVDAGWVPLALNALLTVAFSYALQRVAREARR